MSKHTPGPWKTTTACGLTRINIANDQENRIVCSVPVSIPSRETNAKFGQVDPDAEGEANARLIEAAPELLEALKWYVENDDTNIGQEGNAFWEAGLDRARAAIAKAAGAA